MNLSQGQPGQVYSVVSMSLPPGTEKRLEVLGMTTGTEIQVLNRKGKGILIIKIRGTRLALGKNITQNIEVRWPGEQKN